MTTPRTFVIRFPWRCPLYDNRRARVGSLRSAGVPAIGDEYRASRKGPVARAWAGAWRGRGSTWSHFLPPPPDLVAGGPARAP